MPKIIKTGLICLVIFLCIAALYWLFFNPLLAKAKSTADQVKMKEAELQFIKDKVAHMSVLEANLQNVQDLDKASTPVIPVQLTLSEIYSNIDVLSRACGLKVKQISTNQTFQPFAKDHQLQYIAVNLEGYAYFPQIIQFLDAISKGQFVIQVENIDLSCISKGAKPRLQFKMTLNAFKYSLN